MQHLTPAFEPMLELSVEDEVPVLLTRRLMLRPMGLADVDDLFAIYSDPSVMRHASDPPFERTDRVVAMLASVARLHAERTSFEWGIVDAATGRLVGTCGLHSFDRDLAEVGCLLAQGWWGRGLMREALPALFRHGASLGIRRLRADIDAPNLRSIRLFAGLGFRPSSGTHHERDWP